jgi:aldose 1-epimerase
VLGQNLGMDETPPPAHESTTGPVPPTGRQVVIRHGEHEVTTVAVAAGLRKYAVAGRALVDGFGAGERPAGGRGQTLLPWPNRIAGGRYELDGEQRLAWTEPARENAIHGLARWVAWQVDEVGPDVVTWRHVVVPQPGWPTSLDCRVTYRLADDGLTVSTTAHNVGASRCLYGTGSHPYLSAGTATVDDARLTVPASSWFEVDERGLPIDRHPVDGTEHDLRESRPIGARVLDHAFGDLGRDDAGRCTVRLTAPDGAGVQLWVDSAYGYLQLFSGDTLPAGQARRGLAVEPMTCPPDAFNDADRAAVGVVLLEAGDRHVATWGIAPIAPGG